MKTFDDAIARRLGLEAAVVYQEIVEHCLGNRRTPPKIYNGRAFMHLPQTSWRKLLPYIKSQDIKKHLRALDSARLVETYMAATSHDSAILLYRPRGAKFLHYNPAKERAEIMLAH